MKRKRLKLKAKGVVCLVVFVLIVVGLIFGIKGLENKFASSPKENKQKEEVITDFKNMELSKVLEYAEKNKLEVKTTYEYNEAKEDTVISSELKDKILTIVVSKGEISLDTLKEKGVNELGKVPIMMYHGIVDKENQYTGGNVDKDGYTRTSKAFQEDLEFYYKNNYRMIKLSDYINGEINVELGYSPIILTFDDGNDNNFKVTGRDASGELIFDPMSAVGILESMKKKYPDFQVTAIFFLNSALCNQPEYNEEIMKWLVKNGYEIGNHTISHPDFTKISIDKTKEEVGKMYKKLEEIIPNDYQKIVALPFGSPYKKTHSNYPYILKGDYNGYSYETVAALRVGWESEVSPFDTSFDKTFLKRCRAYDNNGKEFDIEMNFKLLEKNRFISDGDSKIITIPESSKSKLIETDKKVVTY